jgi:hypothetical protein
MPCHCALHLRCTYGHWAVSMPEFVCSSTCYFVNLYMQPISDTLCLQDFWTKPLRVEQRDLIITRNNNVSKAYEQQSKLMGQLIYHTGQDVNGTCARMTHATYTLRHKSQKTSSIYIYIIHLPTNKAHIQPIGESAKSLFQTRTRLKTACTAVKEAVMKGIDNRLSLACAIKQWPSHLTFVFCCLKAD